MSKSMKIGVGILGATGVVGQKFIELLEGHSWFEVAALAASEKSVGRRYDAVVHWHMGKPLSQRVGLLTVQSCGEELPCRVLFSGLDSAVAGPIERRYAEAGYVVISNSSSHRMVEDVPLLIPEVNAGHLELLCRQRYGSGVIVTNPNCSVIGLCMALKPIIDLCGIEAAHVTTLQALSGAGYPGVSAMDIMDNVIPFIGGEEHKVETEPLKIFGSLGAGAIVPYTMRLSAQCTRVPVSDGHMALVSLKLKQKTSAPDIIHAWRSFTGLPQRLQLPSAPTYPLIYLEDEKQPQPRLLRRHDDGMTVFLDRLRTCSLFDWKFVILSHNTVRGAAGSTLLNAELMAHLNIIHDIVAESSSCANNLHSSAMNSLLKHPVEADNKCS